jgi:hypothetical protein
VFENRVLRRKSGPKRDEVTEDWRKLHSKELEKCTRFWWESPREGDHLKDQGVGGKMGSEWILGRLAWGVWIGLVWFRTGTDGGML